MKYFCLVLFVLFFTGCMSIERSASEYVMAGKHVVPGEQVLISNYGYYLFGCIPLFTGSASGRGTAFFRDDATLDKTQKYLSNLADEEGAAVVHIQPMVNSTCSFSVIPYIGSTLGLVWYKEIQLSATIVKVENPDEILDVEIEPKSLVSISVVETDQEETPEEVK
jgi:hypothetical protein